MRSIVAQVRERLPLLPGSYFALLAFESSLLSALYIYSVKVMDNVLNSEYR